MNIIKKILFIFLLIILYFYKKNYKMGLKEYTTYALYMAYLDDEISRLELEGQIINNKKVIFPHKMKSLKYKYDLFLSLNKGKTKKDLDNEVKELEKRLHFNDKISKG